MSDMPGPIEKSSFSISLATIGGLFLVNLNYLSPRLGRDFLRKILSKILLIKSEQVK